MRWLGLRARITVALIAAVACACWVLTVTTTGWAADSRIEQLGVTVQNQAGVDADWVLRALAITPTAHTYQDLYTGLARSSMDDPPSEAALIPVASETVGIRPGLAHQYVFVDTMTPLKDRAPACLVPKAGPSLDGARLAPESSQGWSESCDHYVFGFTLVRAPDAATVPYWLVVRALDLTAADDPVPDLRTTLLTYSAFIALAGLGVAAVLAAMVAAPLGRARGMAEAVAAGDLAVRLPVEGRDEVARMSAAVNTMADRLTSQIAELESANDIQRRFVSDVAHELRTPTAALLASAEALEHPETREEAAVLVAPQLRRLAGLTEDLLEISRIDAGRAEVLPVRFDVMDLVREVIDDCGDAGIQLVGCFPLELRTDPVRLRVILRNLVANAAQHGAPPVRITAESTGELVTIAVSDGGRGIPTQLGEHVFDRFVRGDEARHGSSSGLGLAIARENARLLGGTLDLSGAATFVLRLPAHGPESRSAWLPDA